MIITWESRKGRDRIANRDAVAIGYSGKYLIVVEIDVAEKVQSGNLIEGIDDNGKRLSEYWAHSCLLEIISTSSYENEKMLFYFLHEKQKRLKRNYLHDIASYGVLVMDTTTLRFNWWFTGDCRLGIQKDQQKIEWLNNPHRLENSPLLNVPDFFSPTLTQCLKARRFFRPERITSEMPSNGSLKIATDGYWNEHIEKGVVFENLEDDASLLTIELGNKKIIQKTDALNFFIR
ncbi:MAG: hypothetical protein ACI9IA_002011 [Enterobacterales bacterium]|jgi:hypothetical protein